MGQHLPWSRVKGSTYTTRTTKVRVRPQQRSEQRHRCGAHTISSINICVPVNCKTKVILHADSTKEEASKKQIQRSLDSRMWRRGGMTVTKILPSFVRRALVQQCAYARSEVRVQRRASVQQWR